MFVTGARVRTAFAFLFLLVLAALPQALKAQLFYTPSSLAFNPTPIGPTTALQTVTIRNVPPSPAFPPIVSGQRIRKTKKR